jgi:hypothetical protein
VELLQVDTWNPIVKSPNANHVTSTPARCERCDCWLSRFREEWESRCLPCQQVAPCPAPSSITSVEGIVSASEGYRPPPRVELSPEERAARYAQLERRLAEREAAKVARRLRPLDADHQATKDRWAAWRAEQGRGSSVGIPVNG